MVVTGAGTTLGHHVIELATASGTVIVLERRGATERAPGPGAARDR